MGFGNGADPGALRSLWVRPLRSAGLPSLPAATIDGLLRRFSGSPSLTPESRDELRALSREANAEMFWEGLLAFGRRHSPRSPELALVIFETVAREGRAAAPEVARRASLESDAILGQGDSGRRMEYLGRHFAREATNPAMLAGMTLAGGVFQVSRTAFLSRLIGSSGSSLLTRGLGARLLASGGAFALEVPSFVFGVRAANVALGRELDWSREALGRELASSLVILGALKLAARGAAVLSRNGFSYQAGTLTGIMAGHRLEELLGLAPHRENGTLLVDSLITLAQFHIGGRLSGSILGEGFRRSQIALEWQARELGRSEMPRRSWRNLFSSFAGQEALAPAGVFNEPRSARHSVELRPTILMMEGKDGGESSNPPPSEPPGSSRPPSLRHIHQMVDEISAERERLRRENGEDLPLIDLFRRRAEKESLKPPLLDRLRQGVFYREIFDRSRILREEITPEELSDSDRLLSRLRSVRSRLARELSKRFSLSTLVQSLAYGGRIPLEKIRNYLYRASSYDLYRSSKVLKENLRPEDLVDSVTLLRRLRTLRPEVEAERGKSYSLSTLVGAAAHHRAFTKERLQTYLFAAAAAELVDALPLRKLRLTPAQLQELTRDQVLIRLLKLRMVFSRHREGPVSLGQVLQGLRTLGLDRVKDGEIGETYVAHAHVLHTLYDRWADWGGHFAFLSGIPSRNRRLGWSRIAYGREFLKQADGSAYRDPTLAQFVRWGIFLHENRRALRLAEPEPISPRILASTSARSSLVEFFLANPSDFETRDPEEFLLAMLNARRAFLADGEGPAETPSLRIVVEAFFEAKNQEVDRSLIVSAAALDVVWHRWEQWSPYFRALARMPKYHRLLSRGEFARTYFRQEGGGEFSESALQNYVRWGTLLWQQRGAFALPEPSPGSPEVALPADLAIYEFFERREAEMGLAETSRWSRPGTEEVLSALLRFRPLLEDEIRNDPVFQISFPDGVDITRMTANYLQRRAEQNPRMERDAFIIDNILQNWDSWQVHFRILGSLPEKGRAEYIGRYFPELPAEEQKFWVRRGTWLWRNREDFYLRAGGGENPRVSPLLIEAVAGEVKGLRIPRRVFRPSREQTLQLADAMLQLRRRIAEAPHPPFGHPLPGGEGNRLSFRNLYEWSSYFTGRPLPTFLEAMRVADEMIRDWHFWSLHWPNLEAGNEIQAFRHLRPYFPDATSDQISRYLLIGEWIRRHEAELFLRIDRP